MATASEYLIGVQNALKAGDVEAAEFLRGKAREAQLAEDRVKYAPDVGGGPQQAFTNLGAGMHRAAQGAGQLIGLSTPADVREHDVYRARLAEQSGPGAGLTQFAGEILPSAAIPGGIGGSLLPRAASALTRLAVPTGIAGAAQGALNAQTGENVAGGKLIDATIGAVGGPALAVGAGKVLPWALNKVGDVAAGTLGATGEALGYPRLQAWSRSIGQDRADEIINNLVRQSGMTPQQALAQMERKLADVEMPGIPGAAIPPAAAIESPGLRALHNQITGITGDTAQPLRTAAAQANEARVGGYRDVLAPPRTVQDIDADLKKLYSEVEAAPTPYPSALVSPDLEARIMDAIDNSTGMRKQELIGTLMEYQKNSARKALEAPPVIAAFDNAIDRSVGPVKRELEAMKAEFLAFQAKAMETGRWQPLRHFKEQVFDPARGRLNVGGGQGVANELEAIYKREIRPALDATLDLASGGASRRVMGKGNEAQRLLSEKEQLGEQAKILDILETQVGTSALGDPVATSAKVEGYVNRLMRKEKNKYGGELVSGPAKEFLQKMQAQANALRTLAEADRVAGSATAARQMGASDVIKRAKREGLGLQTPESVGAVGVMYQHPVIAAGLIANSIGKTNLARSTLEALVTALADRDGMTAALQRAARLGADPVELSAVRRYILGTTGASVGALPSQ